MALALNEEQRLLKQSARDFLQNTVPVAALRALRDSKDPHGYRSEHWQAMVDLGWAGIVLPEEYDGLDFGFLGLGAILEETGRNLSPSPLISTVVLGGSAILLAGNPEQKQRWLPEIAAGKLTIALALEEGHHHAPLDTALVATEDQDGYLLNGEKSLVIDGLSADKLLVVARTAGKPGEQNGLSLFLLDSDIPGIEKQPRQLVDSRGAAAISFTGVRAPRESVLGEPGQAWPVIDQMLDRGRICLAAEMLGSALSCFESTVAYLKEREQFGNKIGSFQALQHRAALMFTELELTKSVVLDALSSLDDQRPDAGQMASLAKAKANDVFHLVSSEAVQMHGGIGVTDELDIGFFLKRSRVATQLLGNSGFHRDRYASLCGY